MTGLMNDGGINCDCGRENGCAACGGTPYPEGPEPERIPWTQGREEIYMNSNRAAPLDAEALRAKWEALCESIGSFASDERKAG